jgi:hypothetical protein
MLTLFGEGASRVVISCDPSKVARIREVAKQNQVEVQPLGRTIRGKLQISIGGQGVVSCAVAELKRAWALALEAALHAGAEEELETELKI